MVPGPKRSASSEAISTLSASELASLPDVQVQDLMPLAEDHLAAQVLRLPPGASFAGMSPEGSGGQFYIVMAGSMLHDGARLGRWEQIFVTEDEDAYTVTASDEGLEVIFLQYPKKAAEYLAQTSAEAAS